ncbi:MAG: hypothetical protein HQ464_10535 [Planctomycetes bacterium]|nr:hypothetical protein [Planctomycetota bacterium]
MQPVVDISEGPANKARPPNFFFAGFRRPLNHTVDTPNDASNGVADTSPMSALKVAMSGLECRFGSSICVLLLYASVSR